MKIEKNWTLHIIVVIAFVVFIVLGLACASSPKSSRYSPNWDGYFGYEIEGEDENKEVSIQGYRGESKEVIIPSSIKRLPVTRICGLYDMGLTSVTIPDSVTKISSHAFRDNKLTSVTIPNSVTVIEENAFENNQLTSVTIPNSVIVIERYTFWKNRLTSVTIPNGVTSICVGAFMDNRLTSVTIPNSVTYIDSGAFANNRLTSVTIPNSVTGIGYNVFSNNQLTSVIIPSSVTEIYEKAFADNPITSVTFQADPSEIWFDFKDSLYAYFTRGAGTYEQRNGQWYYNGTALPQPARLVCGTGIYISRIDGKRVGPRLISISNLALRRITDNAYLPPGFHTIEVGYSLKEGLTTTYSEGTVTFEHALVLESDIYDLTGTMQNDQILFRIRRRN